MTNQKTAKSNTLIACLLLVVSYAGARLFLERTDLSEWVRITLAVLPLPFFIWFLWSFIKMQREGDELERKIQLEALAFAFPSALVLLMTLGLLERAIGLNPENFGITHVWQYLPILYFGGVAIASRRYR